jgi:hypothetical protein
MRLVLANLIDKPVTQPDQLFILRVVMRHIESAGQGLPGVKCLVDVQVLHY